MANELPPLPQWLALTAEQDRDLRACIDAYARAAVLAERDSLRVDVRELVELAAETVNEWDSRIVDGDDYAACKRVIENTMAPLRALLAKHKEPA